MKTLTLSLKKKWFDMIKAGVKKEEYREIKDFNLMYNIECASGFHFFRTHKEAKEYNG